MIFSNAKGQPSHQISKFPTLQILIRNFMPISLRENGEFMSRESVNSLKALPNGEILESSFLGGGFANTK